MKLTKWIGVSGTVVYLGVVLTACGGGSSGAPAAGGAATALKVAEKVSVVDAQQSGGGGAGGVFLQALGIGLSQLPPASDFNNDKTNIYVNERSADAFRTVNEILCMVGQSRYDAMLNKGDYAAQIDTNQCSSSKDSASSGGQESANQSSGATMPTYEIWTLNSSRADANSPHIVKAWVHEKGEGGGDVSKVIEAKITITEGASASNPYGLFTMHFKGVDAANPSMVLFKGTMKTEVVAGKVLLKFANEEKDGTFKQYATLDKNPNGTGGAGTVHAYENHGGPILDSTFNIAFDTAHFLRNDGSTPICLDRAQFEESAWRYALYDSTSGARVKRNSGFPIKKGNAYGWVGYWGLWLPQGVTVANGDTVYKHDYSTNADTPYTVMKAGGKLKKHTQKLLTLNDIKNIPLNWNEWNSGTSQWENYQVVWNGTADKFQKIAKQDTSNYTWDSTGYPVDLDLSALQWTELNMWSQSLGGQVRVKLPAPTPTPQLSECTSNGNGTFNCTGKVTSATQVVFYAEDIVYPTDVAVPATLACFDNCPNTVADGSGGKINPAAPFSPYSSNYRSYSFNKSTMVFSLNGNAAVQKDTIPGNDWGIMSGALFDPSTPNLSTLLACDWNPAQICGWKAWSALPVFYTWETGLNDWNRFTALTDGSNVVKFDPPLQVTYTHVQTDNAKPDSKYNGAKFYLDYSGFGNLNGIPGKCVNMDTGLEANCANGGSSSIRWVPAFTIPATQASGDLTEVTDGTNTYLVKALDKEQRMLGVGLGSCSTLTTTTYALPTISDWVDPALGTEPAINGPPAVIGGVVQ